MLHLQNSQDVSSTSGSKQQKQQPKRKRRRGGGVNDMMTAPASSSNSSILSSRLFQFLLFALGATFLVSTELFLMLDWHHDKEIEMLMFWHMKTKSIPHDASSNTTTITKGMIRSGRNEASGGDSDSSQGDGRSVATVPPHLVPRLPYWPPFPEIDNAQQLIDETLNHEQQQPTIAGIAAVLYRFLDELHTSNQHLSSLDKKDATVDAVRGAYYELATKHLVALDKALFSYGTKMSSPESSSSGSRTTIRTRKLHFDIRNDDSIFISVAAYREHLLADTLKSIYENARHPSKVYVGLIVNNCFGNHNHIYQYNDPAQQICSGGVYVAGHNKMGQDILEKLPDGTPDPNGIDEFCSNVTFSKYCHDGQVRVLYVDEVEALGPTVARYYASKLWGGETYYMQIDAHLKFATSWDTLYVDELHATRTYPRAVLSTYPPGFVNFHPTPPFTRGTRLCRCQLRSNEGWLPRVEMEGRYAENATRPSQMPFMGAGFFFVKAQFLADVPFDPFLPWMFMGEEVALSVRAWTNGYNIYAPRFNLIGHQYRPIKMGNPHYQETISKLYKNRPGIMGRLQTDVSKRIKYLLGYYDDPQNSIPGFNEEMKEGIPDEILTEIDIHHIDGTDSSGSNRQGLYGVGNERTVQEYLKFAEIDLHEVKCGSLKWCVDGTLD